VSACVAKKKEGAPWIADTHEFLSTRVDWRRGDLRNSDSAGIPVVWILVGLVFAVLMIASLWRISSKAGRPGWASIVPTYNVYTLLKVVGKPGWWLILYFIPLVDLVIQIIVVLDLARSFSKGAGYALGLIFLPFIFYPILGLGSAKCAGS
jgi:hypothetical protein